MLKRISFFSLLVLITMPKISAQVVFNDFPNVLTVKEKEEIVFRVTQNRLEQLMPGIMKQAGIDMWIIACNEDDLDPVFETMIPYKMWCPITQILVFYYRGPGDVERINISRTNLDGLFTGVWDYSASDNDRGEGQWECLKRIVMERDPQKIGVNIGEIQWAAGGLTYVLHNKIVETLGKKYAARLVSAEPVVTQWLMVMLDEEVEYMERAQQVAHKMFEETFSSAVITPGQTTIGDLRYYYWQRITDLGFELGSHPRFEIHRITPDGAKKYSGLDDVIQPGDFLFVDAVIILMHYYTDHAVWAYVLRPGETDAPENFRKLMAEGNRLQDVFCGEFKEGLTGDEILTNILKKAKAQGIPNPKIFSHSIGWYLHETGPLIGLPWEQVSNPGRGDVKLAYNSCYTAELSVKKEMPELGGKMFHMPLEQVVFFSKNGVIILDGRQTGFYLVK
jgi:hypothetical protein